MKMKKRNRYYKQILTALMIISILPVVFLGYYVYLFVDEQMTAVYRSRVASLENQKEEFETSFEYVDVSLIRMGLKNSCLNVINRKREASNFQIFNEVKEELQLIRSTEQYLDDIYLVSRNQNWILGETFFEDLTQYSGRELICQLLDIPQISFWYSDGDYLYLCKKVPINAASSGAMLIAKFDKNVMVRDIMGDLNGATVMIVDKDNQVMIGEGQAEAIQAAMASPDKMERIYRDTDITSIQYENNSYTVLQSVADYTGWQYKMVMPTEVIMANFKGIVTMVILVLLGLLMTDIMAMAVLTRRLYRPIDEIDTVVNKAIGDDGEASGESGELMSRVRYIADQNLELSKHLNRRKKDVQQLFLRRIYQGEIAEPTAELFEENGFDAERYWNGTYFVLAIKYHNPFENVDDKQLYLFALDNIVSELTDTEETFPPVTIGSVMYLTCCMKTDSNESAVMKMQMLAIMISTTVKKYIDMPLNIGISQGFTNIQNITLGVNESNKALQNAMGAEGEVNFYYSHHTTSESAKGYAAKKQRVQLLHYIDLGERDACKKELDAYILNLSDLYYYVFKLELCKLISEVLNIYNDYALVPDYDKVGDIIDFDIGKTVNTYERLKEYLWNYLLEPLFDTICSQAKERDMMQQVVEYVMENLEKDIGLEECARHFNYNANYLSRWFKKKMGVTYTDFVTEKKMELCKILLVESDISVNELAERFGYSSPQNFIRVFKKYTLLTPGQYRKQEREKVKVFQ